MSVFVLGSTTQRVCWLQDVKVQKNASLEAAKKEAADLAKQLADLKADLQKSERDIEVSVLLCLATPGMRV